LDFIFQIPHCILQVHPRFISRIYYEKNLEVSQKNQEIKQYLKYAEEILAWVKTRYVDREKEIRDQLEEKVNLYFQKMYHGFREVKINYSFTSFITVWISVCLSKIYFLPTLEFNDFSA